MEDAFGARAVGVLYYNNPDARPGDDYEKVLEWLEKAGNMGDLDSMFLAGSIYEHNLKDYGKAKEWFQKGADQGDERCLVNLAEMYENGWGVTKDYAKAMELLLKAADLDSWLAMENISYMYAKGLGVKEDSTLKKEWHDRAVENGLSDARSISFYNYLRF